MNALLGVVTQDPTFVGWVAVLSVVIFIGFAYLLLAVAVGGEGMVASEPSDDPFRPEPAPPREEPRAVPVVAAVVAAPVDPFAESMAASLRAVALAVVERAGLQLGERVLDGGAGRLVSATPALISGRTTLAVDPACGTLAIGRRLAPRAKVPGAEFAALPYPPGWCNAVVAVHTLPFAADPVGVLAEWRRVTGPGGRLSISVPGPRPALEMSTYDKIYERHGGGLQVHVATRRSLASWATAAGWEEPKVFADGAVVIRLPGRDALRTWLETRPWSDADKALSPAELDAIERELLQALPRSGDGQLRIPFGVLYLTARNR